MTVREALRSPFFYAAVALIGTPCLLAGIGIGWLIWGPV